MLTPTYRPFPMPKSRQHSRLAKRVASYTAHFIPAEEGGYTVEVLALPGCVTEGDTLREAMRNAREAIQVYLESLLADHEPIPRERKIVSRRITVPLKARV